MDKSERRIIGSVAWWTLAAIALLLLCIFTERANAQEQYIRACQTSYACQLTPPGGTSWAAGVQTYVFTPMSPDLSLRINVHNQNTTNGHTAQTITVWITGSTTANFSLLNNADRWVQAAIIQNSTANASCVAVAANNALVPGASGQGTCYAQGMYAAQIAIQFTPGGAQAGAPDFFDIDVVQCTSNHCNYPGGPQPGNDSSAGGGGGTIFAATAANVTSSGIGGAELTCIFATGSQGCFPIFDLGLLGNGASLKTVRAVDSGNLGFGGASNNQGLLATGMYGFNGAIAATSQAEVATQSSANATSSQNTTGTTLPGMLVTTGPAGWTVAVQNSASNCSASVAATATTRHCATGADMCLVATVAQTQLFVNLRDGATGAGTVKWNSVLADTAGLGSCSFKEFSTPICGTINTAMTLELSGVTGAGNGCASTLRGYDVQ